MNRRTWLRAVASVGLMLVLAIGTPALGQSPSEATATPAGDAPVFGVAPDGEADLAPFRLDIAAGGTADTTLVVTNEGGAPIELRSYAADVETAINGGYALVPEGARVPEEAAWLTVPTDTFIVDPDKTVSLAITVSVPGGTPPGEYMAALATETTASSALEGTAAFRQIMRKVNAVVISVPGPIEAGFTVSAPAIELADGSTVITATIENTGNARVRPAGVIIIADDAGGTVLEIPVALNSVYAWHATLLQISVSEPLLPGDYLITIDLVDDVTGASATLSGAEVPVQPAP